MPTLTDLALNTPCSNICPPLSNTHYHAEKLSSCILRSAWVCIWVDSPTFQNYIRSYRSKHTFRFQYHCDTFGRSARLQNALPRDDDRITYTGDGCVNSYSGRKRTAYIYAHRHKSTAHNILSSSDSWFCRTIHSLVLVRHYFEQGSSSDLPSVLRNKRTGLGNM